VKSNRSVSKEVGLGSVAVKAVPDDGVTSLHGGGGGGRGEWMDWD
jgi:hypothetical protein